MPDVVLRCPKTGYTVHATTNERPDRNRLARVACAACGGEHVVNSMTGRVQGDDSDAFYGQGDCGREPSPDAPSSRTAARARPRHRWRRALAGIFGKALKVRARS
jgi:hypothetical protein